MISCSYGQKWNDPSAAKLSTALSIIENMYVDTVNSEQLANDAIRALLQKLDPHSEYMTPEEVKDMNEPLQGNFDGIGIQFNLLSDTLYIVQVIPGGPSEKVGLMAGDRILFVNDTLVAGIKMKNTDVQKKLRGPKGTTVTVKVMRGKNPSLIPFKIVRGQIPLYSLDASYMLDKTTGYIKLNRFAATTYEEFKKAWTELHEQGATNLILDLQDNGGGYLQAAAEITNEFLHRGNLIVYTQGVHQPREDARATLSGSIQSGKVIVLINESSASASEIVTGALQDWDRAVVVGRRSFGKGLVQRPLPFPDGSMIKLTTARYYTPTGRNIQKPYENGNSDLYSLDLIKRYNNGEMLSADSIHFPDSLKYQTLVNKRVVYGGGGIMPDYFVPIDTTRYTAIHRSLIGSGAIQKYAMGYFTKHRETLHDQYPTFADYKSTFEVTPVMLKELLSEYQKEIDADKKETPAVDEEVFLPEDVVVLDAKSLKDFQKSASLIRLQIKALLAQNLWNTSEYFQIINVENDALKRGLDIIRNDKEYNKLLGK
jgi:carboxyl-terminal processing protease